MTIRVRFAPSPTGYLHIGGARTALFNWLFARKMSGQMLVRIEDTDEGRSSQELTQGILAGMAWLGLDWDEGPYYQSQRIDVYKALCDKLLEVGFAYRCFCQKVADKEPGSNPESASHSCRETGRLASSERARSEAAVVRFKVPSGQTVSFVDIIHGEIQVDSKEIEDFALLRSDGSPTYHLSVVADDLGMGITDVIRGADHLSNTPKQILVYQAIGRTPPRFAHLPLILGPDKTRLSKRHGATSILEFRREGFLPAALRNYLLRLGWSGSSDREFFEDKEAIEAFQLAEVHRSNAVWSPEKLEWVNAKMMGLANTSELAEVVRQQLESADLWKSEWGEQERSIYESRIALLQAKVRRTTDFLQQGRAFFTDDFDYQEDAVEAYLSVSPEDPKLVAALKQLLEAYQALRDFDLVTTEKTLRSISSAEKVKAGHLIGAVRVALTGQKVAPGIFEVIIALGQATVVRRLQRVISFLGA